MSLSAALVAVAELGPRRTSAWRDLVARAVEPNPFFEPTCLLATVHHRRTPVNLLTVSEGADLVGCLPLYGHLRMSRLRWPVWSTPNVLGVPHVDPVYAGTALRVALEFLAGRWGRRRLLRLFRVPTGGMAGPALLAAARDMRCAALEPPPLACPMIRRRPHPTYLDDTLKGPTRSKVGQKRRDLEKLLGQRLRIVDRAADHSAVERFLALEASGWKGRGHTAMLTVPGEADFFRAICADFAAGDRLRLLSLEAGDTVVAMRCDVAAGDGLFSLKTSYDERFARFSPGLLLDVAAVSVFHESSAAWLNSTTNGASSPVFLLYPDHQELVDAVVALGPVTRQAIEWVLGPARRQWLSIGGRGPRSPGGPMPDSGVVARQARP